MKKASWPLRIAVGLVCATALVVMGLAMVATAHEQENPPAMDAGSGHSSVMGD